MTNDVVCCEIIEISSLSEKLVVGMKGLYLNRTKYQNYNIDDIKLGLIRENHLPEKYK